MQTRSCRTGKVYPCAHVLNESTRAKSRGGYLRGKVRISIYARHASSPTTLDKRNRPLAVICGTCVQKQRLTWCARAGSGEGRGGETQQSERGCRPPPKIDTSVWPARHCSHWQLPRSTIEHEDRRRGEERMRGCNERMWRKWSSFYMPLGTPSSHRDSHQRQSRGRRRSKDKFMLEFMFREQ